VSPAATLTTEDACAAVLASADALFYERGIGAVRMADVRDQSGVSMRRLYSIFPTKSDLVTGWLEHRHGAWMRMFTTGIDHRLAGGEDPAAAVFGSLGDWLLATSFRGCAFVNALAETAEVTETHRQVIRRHKQGLIDVLARFSDHAPALAVLVDGAIVQAAVFGSTGPVDAAQAAATPLFDVSPPRQD
jgi:AcrR family transcriptional regulator